MPPTIQPPHLRELNALIGGPSNRLAQLTSRQGLDGGNGPEGPPGNTGATGKAPPVGMPEAQVAREAAKLYAVPAAITTVYLSLKLKAENSEWEVKIDGVRVFKADAEVLTAASLDFSYTLRIKAGGTWELVMVKGAVAELQSSYQEG